MPQQPSVSRGWILVALVGLLLVILLSRVAIPSGSQTIPYSQFLTLLGSGQVVNASISSSQVSGTYRSGTKIVDFSTVRPPGVDDAALLRQLQAEHVQFTGSQPSSVGSFFTGLFLTLLLPLLLLAALWIFLMRRFQGAAGSAMTLGRSRHRIVDRSDLHTTFADVAGADEAVEELGEVVDFLKHPERYQRLGGRIPRGVLLVGPPGAGKTLLARAVAGEASVPFFFLSGSDFVELFVGLGAARVRDLFEQAKAKAPCIVFIDEVDTIGKSRSGALPGQLGGHDEREQTLNQLLTEMDGFDPSAGVIIMAATNRPEVLDSALLRPGRFDRQIVVDLPDRRGRAAILLVHARDVRLARGVDLDVIAARTPGAAGAELENVVNEAALLAARRGKQTVDMAEIEEAVDRVSIGLERRSRVLREEERERVAYHELGHALVALTLPNADPVHRVSIIPRGVGALGITQQLPAEDRYLVTQPELEDRLAVMMGGRAAEVIVYGQLSTGAQNDLRQATMLARRMVEEFGMSKKVGPLALARPSTFLGDGHFPEPVSNRMASEVDAEVKRLLEAAESTAESILAGQHDELVGLARLLLERETLEGDELRAALADRREARDATTGLSPARAR